jgi:protein-S-isoprenylcysteine O-methyltransferase Ste14
MGQARAFLHHPLIGTGLQPSDMPMMSSQTIFFVSAGCIFGGALLGLLLSRVLPEEHLRDKSKDTVKVVTGMIATLAALVLGLLISSANTSFDAVDTAITQSAARVILLDRALANYGPETKQGREELRRIVVTGIEMFWPGEESKAAGLKGFEQSSGMEALQTHIRTLTPTTDLQGQLRSEADKLSGEMLQARWLLIAQAQHTIPAVFVVVLLFWLTMLHISFGLLAPRNATAITMLLISAVSVSGAILLILEMNQPLSGLIKVSNAPLLKALEHLGR